MTMGLSFSAIDQRVVGVVVTIFTTLLWIRWRKMHRGMPHCKKGVPCEVKHLRSSDTCDESAHLTSLPSGLLLLSELQLLNAAPFDPRSLGRLAACSSQLHAYADTTQLWQPHFDALAVAARVHIDLGIASDPVSMQGQGKLFPPGCRVRLGDLTNGDYNGLLGTVLPKTLDGERVAVQLDAPQGKRILLKHTNLTLLDLSEIGTTRVHPKALLCQALSAMTANETFYAAFRAGDRRRMRALWLDDTALKLNVVKQLLGTSNRPVARFNDGGNRDADLPLKAEGSVFSTRCVHPGQSLLLGHRNICHSWDLILGSGGQRAIRPTKCEWELDGHGRARVTLVEQIAPGISVRATNAFVIMDDTWRMITHVAG